MAVALGTTPRTVRKWRDRFAAEGEAGLRDRSSRPHRSPSRLTAAAEAEIATLRRRRLSGPVIARQLGRPVSSVGVALRRLGLGHRITGDRTGQSSRRSRGEGLGWEYLHVAIDDASRLAYTALMPDENAESAVRFLEQALAWFGAHGVGVERVMTDNGPAFKSRLFAAVLQAQGLKHKRTRPYTPRTNGKAERFIQTSLREWAYAMPFHSSAERARAMPAWLCHYNSLRPHSALARKPPISRLPRNNLLGNDT